MSSPSQIRILSTTKLNKSRAPLSAPSQPPPLPSTIRDTRLQTVLLGQLIALQSGGYLILICSQDLPGYSILISDIIQHRHSLYYTLCMYARWQTYRQYLLPLASSDGLYFPGVNLFNMDILILLGCMRPMLLLTVDCLRCRWYTSGCLSNACQRNRYNPNDSYLMVRCTLPNLSQHRPETHWSTGRYATWCSLVCDQYHT